MVIEARKFEVLNASVEDKEHWKEIAAQCQKLKCWIWTQWWMYHQLNDSPQKIVEDIEAYRHWRESEKIRRNAGNDSRGSKSQLQQLPKPVQRVFATGELSKQIGKRGDKKGLEVLKPALEATGEGSLYDKARKQFPNLLSTIITSVISVWMRNLKKRRSTVVNMPSWQAILLNHESLPSFRSPQPIPFSGRTGSQLVPVVLERKGKTHCEGGEPKVEAIQYNSYALRVVMHSRNCPIGAFTFDLMVGKSKAWKDRVILDKIVRGEFTWRGSSLIYENGKWFALIVFERPEVCVAGLDDNNVLFVKAGRNTPLLIASAASGHWTSVWRVGVRDGFGVKELRNRVEAMRRVAYVYFRNPPASKQGHGRSNMNRRLANIDSMWRNQSKNINFSMSKIIVNEAVKRGCKRIVYFQPGSKTVGSRFLSGLNGSFRSSSSSGWSYFDLGSRIAHRCSKLGITYECRKEKSKVEFAESNV